MSIEVREHTNNIIKYMGDIEKKMKDIRQTQIYSPTKKIGTDNPEKKLYWFMNSVNSITIPKDVKYCSLVGNPIYPYAEKERTQLKEEEENEEEKKEKEEYTNKWLFSSNHDFSGGYKIDDIPINFEEDSKLEELDLVGVHIPYLFRLDVPDSLNVLSIGGPSLRSVACPYYSNGGINGDYSNNYGSLKLKNVHTLNIYDVQNLYMFELQFRRSLKVLSIKHGDNIDFHGLSIPSSLETLYLEGLTNTKSNNSDGCLNIGNININYANYNNLQEFIVINSDFKKYNDIPKFPRNIRKIILINNQFENTESIFNRLCIDYPFVGEIKVDKYHLIKGGTVSCSIYYIDSDRQRKTIYYNIPTTINYNGHNDAMKKLNKDVYNIGSEHNISVFSNLPGITNGMWG
tara:strand:+ start:159 stop:1364 length:1206 start_codon:yes stop_codon:yes gene_type:complete